MSNAPLRLLTNSELKTFRRCVREHHLAYNLGYRPTLEAEALRVGTLVHLGLEAYWRAWVMWLTDPLAALQAAYDAMLPFAIDGYDLARAETMLLAYHERWLGAYRAGHFDVLGVEVEFKAPMLNPASGAASRTYELGGKIDALIRRENGRVYLVEHKTTTEDIGVGTPYWLRLTIDAQVSMYYRGARAIGHDVVGCEYDVLTRPMLRPLMTTPVEKRQYKKNGELYANQRDRDETPDEFRARLVEAIADNPDRYFQRGEVVRFDTEERDAAFDTWQTARAMRDAELAERWPRNPEACVRFGGSLCTYFGVCTGTASLDDPNEFRRVTNVHEELSAAIGGAA